MIAYARLDNIKKVIDVVSANDPKILSIESQIALEKVVELILLDLSGKKNEYDAFLSSYDEDLESLDNETNARTRYLNNILEIERNNFEDKKAKLVTTTKELRKAVYPALIKNKKDAGEKLKQLKKENDRIKKDIIHTNDNDTSIFNKVKEGLSLVYDKYQDILSNTIKESFNDKENFSSSIHVFVKNILNIYQDFENEINIVLTELDYKNVNKYVYDKAFLMDTIDKITNQIIESTYTNNPKYENKSLGYINRQISSTRNKLDSILDMVRPYNEKELNDILNEKDTEYKERIAKVAIENTIKSTPQLDEIDKINEAAIDVRKGYENDIANFKAQYLASMDAIKKDYQERYDKLTSLKDVALAFNSSIDTAITNRVNEAYEEIKTKVDENIKKIIKTSDSQKDIASEMVDVLSDEIQVKNNSLFTESNNIKDDNARYRDELSKKAIEYYQNIELIIKNNELSLNRLKNEKLAYRKHYIQSLNQNAAEFKKAYFDTRSKLINDSEINILDKTLEFTEKYNKIKNGSYDSLEQIEKPINKYIETTESLSDNLINKANDVTKNYTDNAIKSLDDFKEELDKIIDKYS